MLSDGYYFFSIVSSFDTFNTCIVGISNGLYEKVIVLCSIHGCRVNPEWFTNGCWDTSLFWASFSQYFFLFLNFYLPPSSHFFFFSSLSAFLFIEGNFFFMISNLFGVRDCCCLGLFPASALKTINLNASRNVMFFNLDSQLLSLLEWLRFSVDISILWICKRET